MLRLVFVLLLLCREAAADPLHELLQGLRPHLDYLREIPGRPDQPVERQPDPIPDASPLIGVERSRLTEGLGAPTGCIDRDSGMSCAIECKAADEWWYSFYKLPPRTPGGGLELVLSFDNTGRCTSARWLHSQ
jgi:hypothetical protein